MPQATELAILSKSQSARTIATRRSRYHGFGPVIGLLDIRAKKSRAMEMAQGTLTTSHFDGVWGED